VREKELSSLDATDGAKERVLTEISRVLSFALLKK